MALSTSLLHPHSFSSATFSSTFSPFSKRNPFLQCTCKPLVSRNIIRFEKVSCKITNNSTNINANSNIVKLADVVGDDVTCSLPHSMSNDGTFKLLSVSPLPLLALAALPGAEGIASLFQPIADIVRSLGLPDWLVHWGHPGNMAVVLFAMGGYGSYLGWQIRLSDDLDVKAKAKDLHPKLLGGMFFFFALGATGGILSLLTSEKPILESPHAITGFLGLAALAGQTALTTAFEGNPSLRSAHAYFGSGIMLLFIVHLIFGVQLGLSY